MRRLMLICCLSLPAFGTRALAGESYTTGDITVSDVWARATNAPRTDTAGYMTIDNKGAADQLDGLTCTGTLGATMDEPNAKTGSAGLMAPLGTNLMPVLMAVAIPAHGRVQFKPGGRYFKLQDVATTLKADDTVACTLTFSINGPLDVLFTVAKSDAVEAPK